MALSVKDRLDRELSDVAFSSIKEALAGRRINVSAFTFQISGEGNGRAKYPPLSVDDYGDVWFSAARDVHNVWMQRTVVKIEHSNTRWMWMPFELVSFSTAKTLTASVDRILDAITESIKESQGDAEIPNYSIAQPRRYLAGQRDFPSGHGIKDEDSLTEFVQSYGVRFLVNGKPSDRSAVVFSRGAAREIAHQLVVMNGHTFFSA